MIDKVFANPSENSPIRALAVSPTHGLLSFPDSIKGTKELRTWQRRVESLAKGVPDIEWVTKFTDEFWDLSELGAPFDINAIKVLLYCCMIRTPLVAGIFKKHRPHI